MGSRIKGTEGIFRLGPQLPLTSRERSILNALWSGKTTKQVAEHIGLSLSAVKVARHRLRQKYQVSNAAELIRAALNHGDLTVI